jgi:hypothetical protein
MSTLVSDPSRQSAITQTAKRIFREALQEVRGCVSELSLSDATLGQRGPCNKTLWHLLIIVGITITLVIGIGFRLMQDQLNTVEAYNQLVLQELKEVHKFMEAERKKHYYDK